MITRKQLGPFEAASEVIPVSSSVAATVNLFKQYKVLCDNVKSACAFFFRFAETTISFSWQRSDRKVLKARPGKVKRKQLLDAEYFKKDMFIRNALKR